MRRLLPFLLFVVSGAAALVFETVFLRQLAWLFGNSATATALVLSSFMAGLALGATVFGRIADRTPHPLRMFGLLELAAAASGSLLVLGLGPGRQLFLAPVRLFEASGLQRGVELLLAFVLVLVPSMLMGGTLPALTRAVVRNLSHLVGSLGLLYGMNTLGAAAGVFLAGFVLFERLGVMGSAFAAAGTQAVVGIVAIVLAGRERGGESAARTGEVSAVAPGPLSPDRVRAACLVAAAAGGAAMLGYEVLWTRLLSLFMRSFSYSFSLMLSLFLLGLCLGAILLAALSSRIRSPVSWLAVLLSGMGLWVAASVIWMPDRLGRIASTGFADFLVQAGLRAAWIVLPPTVLSGMALPIAVRGFAAALGRLGADVGRVYAFNTVGAIVGALGAGLVLLPALGVSRSLVLLAAFNALAGVAVLAITRAGALRVGVAAVVALACLLPMARGSSPFVRAFLEASPGAQTLGEVLYYREGVTDTVAIVKREYGFFDVRAKSLITNGIAMTATVKPVWRYMSAEGHLPVLLSRDPRRALAVGVGTGITLNALASHPRLESIVAIELSDAVAGGLELFEYENGDSPGDPRVRMVQDDGRHWMELNDETFDVITLEPPPPIVAGSVHLYSLDFYRLCNRRLAEGGVVAQWLPLHAQSEASARMTARTFLEAYPHAMLWLPSVRDAVLIGSLEPLELDVSRLREAYATPETRANLTAAYLENPEALMATFLLDRGGIETWVGDAPVITDEHPWMEFFLHQGGNMDDADIAPLLDVPQADLDWLDADETTLARITDENRALRSYAESTVLRDARAGVAAARNSRATEFFLYPHGCTSAQIEALRSGEHGLSAEEISGRLRACDRLRS
ncbi:MAG: methyltransferase domain-containing protein [Acidobacteria bacterium]|nr:methyltransferase domain-containing protein [Acidobacteriota bacterium]NIM61225.1 methyltransferase domain-containing protein [Acidobacteriota bacterium]NIO59603.1 methyltransferase domain-containing protein [Acidobacteriota bacterium]NIQ30696.1 methyltransferase domain-containing protein [Acidobacteriota bacterium]NIQ85669.1 methyltransferase domain-containing protein [Acidobacteriota bacterium]